MAAAASRSAARAMVKAMDKIIAKGKKIAAHLMEASVDDIEFKDGKFTVAGTDRSKTLGEISLAAYVPHNYPIEELEPGLDETAFYDPKNFTFPGGCHICEVEIDPDTGVVQVVQFRRGRRCRPGHQPDDRRGPGAGRRRPGHRPGAAGKRRLRQAAASCCPARSWTTPCRAPTTCRTSRSSTENTMCTHNPLGSKGCGEVGAIGSPPAVINAVVDALKRLRRPPHRHAGQSAEDLVDHPMPASRAWRPSSLSYRRTRDVRFRLSEADQPRRRREALGADAEAKALAGGQTFIPVLKQRLNKPTHRGRPVASWA